MAENKLRRSNSNKVLGGLCGGLGEYFNIDPTMIRLVWILAAFWIGIPAIIAYLLGLIVISINEKKDKPLVDQTSTEEKAGIISEENPVRSKSHLIWGWLIVGVGLLVLLESLDYLDQIKKYILPIVLIGAGIWVLIKGFNRNRV